MSLLNVHNPARNTTFSLRISICIWYLIYPMKTSFTCRWRGQSQEGQMPRPHSRTLHKLFHPEQVVQVPGESERCWAMVNFSAVIGKMASQTKLQKAQSRQGEKSRGWLKSNLPNFLLCDSCFPDPISLGTSGDLSENHRGFWIWAPPCSLPGPQVPGPAGAC